MWSSVCVSLESRASVSVEFSLWCLKALVIDRLSVQLNAAVTFQPWSPAPCPPKHWHFTGDTVPTVALIDREGTFRFSAHMREFEEFSWLETMLFFLTGRWCCLSSLIACWLCKVHRDGLVVIRASTNDYFHLRLICQLFSWLINQSFSL